MKSYTGYSTTLSIVFVFAPALAFASFDTSLQIGARGSAVISLQQFLISQNLLSSDSATGYFGKLTQKAVVAFQVKQGVVPSSGFFGPLTRAKANSLMSGSIAKAATTTLNGLPCAFHDPLVPDAAASWQNGQQVYFPLLTEWQVCKDGQWVAPPAPTLTALPASGTATLTVTFSGLIPGHSCPRPGTNVDGESIYNIDYGDNQKEELTFIPTCSATYSLKHSYSSSGIYNATLIHESYAMGQDVGSKILGTTTVTVK